MKKSELKELYKMMLSDYPDIVTIRHLTEMLGISRTMTYSQIGDGEIQAVMIGISYKIPKVSFINFVTQENEDKNRERKTDPTHTSTAV